MDALRIETPSRLHFGLLAWGEDAPRQFGGVGLMIDRPGLSLTARAADAWRFEGPAAERAERVAAHVTDELARAGHRIPPLALRIDRAPPEHVGLGTGTQLSLAVARAVTSLSGLEEMPAAELAALTGRGQRSGIGLHGFARGGLIVDGGRRAETTVPPLLCRLEFPRDWHVLLVLPRLAPGLHGPAERRAFAALPPVPEARTDRLCRLVLLGLLPAVAEADLARFGQALGEIQHEIGLGFAPAQGGTFADPRLESIARAMGALGLHGVGQSSWGPALYGFSQDLPGIRARLERSLLEHAEMDGAQCLWTRASSSGSTLTHPSEGEGK